MHQSHKRDASMPIVSHKNRVRNCESSGRPMPTAHASQSRSQPGRHDVAPCDVPPQRPENEAATVDLSTERPTQRGCPSPRSGPCRPRSELMRGRIRPVAQAWRRNTCGAESPVAAPLCATNHPATCVELALRQIEQGALPGGLGRILCTISTAAEIHIIIDDVEHVGPSKLRRAQSDRHVSLVEVRHSDRLLSSEHRTHNTQII